MDLRSLPLARRAVLSAAAGGLGSLALGSLDRRATMASAADASPAPATAAWPGVIRPYHVPPKAKRVIWLYMAGGMSHLDTFDHKPKLAEMNGQPMPESFTAGQQLAQLQGNKLACMAPQHAFRRWGQSGQEISEIFPEISARIADRIAIVRSMRLLVSWARCTLIETVAAKRAATPMSPGSKPIVLAPSARCGLISWNTPMQRPLSPSSGTPRMLLVR
jgi:hypothetical protein